MAINNSVIFEDEDQENSVAGIEDRVIVDELPDAPDPVEGDGDLPPGGEEAPSDSNPYGEVEDLDIWIGKLLLSLFDDTRANWLSTYAFGSIEHSDRYRYYQNLEDKKHKHLVMAMAVVVRKYRLSKAPEIIILIAMATSTYFLYTMARTDRQREKEKQEQAMQEALRKQQQQMQYKQQNPGGKVIKINNNQAKAQL